MSLRVKKTIGIRSNLRSRDFNKKYIFVFEGEKTEKQYFEKLSNCKGELGINDLIHIEILEKLDETKSNQLSVVKSLDDYIRSIVDMKESVEVIKKRIKDMVISKFNDSDDIKIKILELIDECFIDDKYDINIDRFIDTVRGLIIDVDIDVLIEDIRSLVLKRFIFCFYFFASTKVFFHLPDSDKHFYECIIDINGCFKK